VVLYVYVYYLLWVRPRLPKVPPGTGVGLDVRVFLGPVFWLIGLIGFATGFLWRYRGAAR
jgi:hypothetical protein